MFGKRGIGCLALVAAALLSACASKPSAPPTLSAPIAPATPRPVPPAGAAANLVIPPVGADGSYATINRGLSSDQTVWHVRSAFNVAALNCPGAQGKAIAAGYNQLLHKQRKVLKTAYSGSAKAHSSAASFDTHATRVYNFFAQPSATAAFCRVSEAGIAEANETADFRQYAAAALPRLEAPFLDFYRRYDDYRRDLAAWTAGNGRIAKPVATASAQPAIARPPIPQAAPAASAAPTAGSAAWRVQLGAFSSEKGALSSWSEARAKVSAFASLEPKLENVPAKSLVRLQAGPVRDRAEANKLCATAIAAGQNCLPVAPSL